MRAAAPLPVVADTASRVVDDLEAGTAVRHGLPGGGRVHIDRPLPFLCVHATGGRPGLAATEVARANAAYLVAPDLAPAAPVINAVGRAMARRFGAFLVVEVGELARDTLLSADSPYLPPFETIVASEDRPGSRAAAEAFVAAMEAVEVRYRSPRIERRTLTSRREGWAADLDPALARLDLRFAPIYRQPRSQRVYPDLRERVIANVFDAELHAVAAFAAATGAMQAPTHRALGRRVFVEAVRRVDARIDRIVRSFDFLLAVTPINADAAWAAFEASGFRAAPTLLYRPLSVRIDAAKRQLHAISFDNLEDPLLYELYRQKQQEIDLQLTLIAARDTRRFREASRMLYGPVEPPLLRAADDILGRVGAEAARRADDGATVGAEELRRQARRMVQAYRGGRMGFAARISLRDDLPAGMMVSGPRLLISRATRMPRRRVEALLSHEVGVHLFTYFAGDAQGLRVFRSGLADYEGMQEGLAVFAEYLAGGMTRTRLRLLAARVVGCAAMLDGAEFAETFALLTRSHGLPEASAFNVTLRLYRSGGLAKDAIYLRGLLEVLDHLRRGGSLDPFWMGKISAAHFPAMEELAARGLLKPPPVLPAFLSRPGADTRLAAARGGLDPVDLIDA